MASLVPTVNAEQLKQAVVMMAHEYKGPLITSGVGWVLHQAVKMITPSVLSAVGKHAWHRQSSIRFPFLPKDVQQRLRFLPQESSRLNIIHRKLDRARCEHADELFRELASALVAMRALWGTYEETTQKFTALYRRAEAAPLPPADRDTALQLRDEIAQLLDKMCGVHDATSDAHALSLPQLVRGFLYAVQRDAVEQVPLTGTKLLKDSFESLAAIAEYHERYAEHEVQLFLELDVSCLDATAPTPEKKTRQPRKGQSDPAQ